MAQEIIARGKVVFLEPNFYLVDTTARLLGMKAKRYVHLYRRG